MTATVAWMRECMRASAATPSESPVQVGATSAGSELSRQVPVDLEADADLNEGRGAPGHWSSALRFLNEYVKSRRAGAQCGKSRLFTSAVRTSSMNVCEHEGGNNAIASLDQRCPAGVEPFGANRDGGSAGRRRGCRAK